MNNKKTTIKAYESKTRKIYAFTLPGVDTHKNHVKIGETTRDNVMERINEQLGLNKKGVGTTAIRPKLLWEGIAQRVDMTWFRDKDFHRYIEEQGIERAKYDTPGATEWFMFGENIHYSKTLFESYKALTKAGYVPKGRQDYQLRPEQKKAVNQTLGYYYNKDRQGEYLWNAKPRFGKTLTAYDFMKEINAEQVLIVTNRPTISNAWVDDFNKFIAGHEPSYYFVSESESLKDKGVYTRQEYVDMLSSSKEESMRMVAFVSLQDLKGSVYFGGGYEKLEWLVRDWDLLIIDEAHEGVDTDKMDTVLDTLTAEFTLHLSGTPFKILAQSKFEGDQIFNWTYLDEQVRKNEWGGTPDGGEQTGTNPYEDLPEMQMFTYQIGDNVRTKLTQGVLDEEGDNYDYAFSLNEFFKTEGGKFVNEAEVVKFLDNLTTGDMPFSPTQYKDELHHTLWLLNRVASVKALEQLLRKHPVFKDYTVIIAAGDGKASTPGDKAHGDDSDLDNQMILESEDDRRVTSSYKRVLDAIEESDKIVGKTITLSVGQLTTGVTIPQWTGVMMLSDIKSPALYFQAAFRSQSPHSYEDERGRLYRKERAYIFDFSPERTLELYNEFANNLTNNRGNLTDEERKENIRELLNFFPIISKDEQGKMVELDATNVMTYPNRIKAQHVVEQGFMSNLLFKNVHGIFSANQEIRDILSVLPEEKNKKIEHSNKKIESREPLVNEDGEVDIPQELTEAKTNSLFKDNGGLLGGKRYSNGGTAATIAKDITETVMTSDTKEKYKEDLGLTKKDTDEDVKEFTKRIEDKIRQKQQQQQKDDTIHLNKELAILAQMEKEDLGNKELTDEQKREIKTEYQKLRDEVKGNINTNKEVQGIQETELQDIVKETQNEMVEKRLVQKETVKKDSEESDIRDRLRGFTRTIPAALLAYGDSDTTIDSYERYIPDDVFEDLTSITKDQFKLLRDGWHKHNKEGQPLFNKDGEPVMSEGFFNKPVFNEAIKAFFIKKEELTNYELRDSHETIFNYVPLQKTNQQFTPVSMVRKMVDVLEEEIPGIFSDPSKTFLDPYAKSGLFIEEIAKRLMKGLAGVIKDEGARLNHIYTKQLYAIAPSTITYQIVKNHINRSYWHNIKHCDLTESAVNKKMQETINELFGGENMKFDVIIGNPPYQENFGNKGGNKSISKAVYHHFISEAIKMNPQNVIMITPSRWMTKSTKGITSEWVDKMIKSGIKFICDYEDSTKIFQGVDIKGGVSYFLWEINYKGHTKYIYIPTNDKNEYIRNGLLDEHNIGFVVRDPRSYTIIDKIAKVEGEYFNTVNFSELVSPLALFSTNEYFRSNWKGFKTDKSDEYKYKYYLNRQNHKREYGWVSEKQIPKNKESIGINKVYIPAAGGTGSDSKVLGKPFIGEPGSLCSETYLVIGYNHEEHNLTVQQCEAIIKYIHTRLFRYLVSIKKKTQNGARGVYQLVPMQDFTSQSDIKWSESVRNIEKQLYTKYQMSDEDINFIESQISEMD